MIHTYHTPELTDLHDDITHALLADKPRPDRGGGGTQQYGIAAQADSCEYDYDLERSWVRPSRWRMLTKQYVNDAALDEWLALIHRKLNKRRAHGVAFLRSNLVKPRGTVRISRVWGSCMIGWSFRVFPTPHLTMHSRSTYLGYLAPLDIGVAAILAELAGEEVGLDPQEIGFTWFLEQATFHYLRSMPWLFTDGGQQLLADHPQRTPDRYLARFDKLDAEGRLYGDMAYAQERRYRMAYHSQIHPERVADFLGEGEYATVEKNPSITRHLLSDLPFETSE